MLMALDIVTEMIVWNKQATEDINEKTTKKIQVRNTELSQIN